MSRLLRASFARLKKDKTFWICMAMMFGIGALFVISNYVTMKFRGYGSTVDDALFSYGTYIGMFLAAFSSLYIGKEYSDGTIRNKLVVGHSRSSIYLSNLIVNMAVSLLLAAAYIVAVLGIGIPLLGGLHGTLESVLRVLFGSVMMAFALASVFTLLSMLNQNKAAAAVIGLAGFFVFVFFSIYIHARLLEPKVYEAYSVDENNGKVVTEEAEPNPNYLTGTKRALFEFAEDFLPTGQSLQLSQRAPVHYERMLAYSAVICVITTAGGVYFFRKKDLK